jgi:hypothetical protein
MTQTSPFSGSILETTGQNKGAGLPALLCVQHFDQFTDYQTWSAKHFYIWGNYMNFLWFHCRHWVKVKLYLCFVWTPRHEGVLESGAIAIRIAPRIPDIGSRWSWVVIFTPQPLYSQGKGPWYPLDRTLGGHQRQSGRGGEEKNSKLLPEFEPPIIHAVAQRYTSELSRLLQ